MVENTYTRARAPDCLVENSTKGLHQRAEAP